MFDILKKDIIMKKAIIFALIFCFSLLPTLLFAKDVHVKGYYRKDGTYVRPHYRSAPDRNFYNNWSTKGNINPYTGKPGTKVIPPSSYKKYPYSRSYSTSPKKYNKNIKVEQRGCCSWHGGVCGCNEEGRVICCDGTLSPTCRCNTSNHQSLPHSSYNSSITPSTGNYDAKPVIKPFIVYLKNGRELVCDYVGRDGNNILLVMHGKEFVIRYDESEIDVKKSFHFLPNAPSSLKATINQMK